MGLILIICPKQPFISNPKLKQLLIYLLPKVFFGVFFRGSTPDLGSTWHDITHVQLILDILKKFI